MSRTALYRHFDAAGALLYIGISASAVGRLQAHCAESPWAEQISRVEIEWFNTREDAELAEWKAIHAENPVYNVRRPTNPPNYTPNKFSRSPALEPAASIIKLCGGFAEVAAWVGCHEIGVRRWTYSRDRKGGTGGLVPARHAQTLLTEARQRGIPLNPDHFFGLHAKDDWS